jgi:hypothetical protein
VGRRLSGSRLGLRPLRSKRDGDRGRRRFQLAKTSQDGINIGKRKDWSGVNRDHIRTTIFPTEVADAKGLRGAMSITDVGTEKAVTATKGETQRVVGRGIEGQMEIINSKERLISNVEVKRVTAKMKCISDRLNGIRIIASHGSKKTNIGRAVDVRSADKGFIEGDMLGFFNQISGKVIVKDIFEGLRVAKKNAFAGVMLKSTRAAGPRRKNSNLTTKGTQVAKVGRFASAEFIPRFLTVTMGNDVIELEVMMKGVGPEPSRESSTSKN